MNITEISNIPGYIAYDLGLSHNFGDNPISHRSWRHFPMRLAINPLLQSDSGFQGARVVTAFQHSSSAKVQCEIERTLVLNLRASKYIEFPRVMWLNWSSATLLICACYPMISMDSTACMESWVHCYAFCTPPLNCVALAHSSTKISFCEI